MGIPEQILRISCACAISAGLTSCTRQNPDWRTAALATAHLPELDNVKISSHREHELKGMKVHEFTGTLDVGDVNISRIENVEAAVAARILDQKRFQLESLSQEQKSPYPGEISSQVKCSGAYLPVLKKLEHESFSGLRVEAAANARKNVGVCGDAEFSYDAVFVYLYCKKQKLLLQIESYFPRSKKPVAWLDQASC